MKSHLISIILLFAGIYSGKAQEKIKFGEVPMSDLSMTVYSEDTTAIAVTLHEDCILRYNIMNNDFQVVTIHTIRVKVLKPAGLDRANINLPFYTGNSRIESEEISSITGYTYNLVNGKLERTKLSKQYIFEEKTSDRWRRKKIAFPNVQVGSVFELKYEKTSPFYHYLDDFHFQSSIPVRYSRFQLTIPEYFNFRKRSVGYERVDYSEKNVNLSFSLDGGKRLFCNGQEMTFVATNLPALKDDSYVWNKNDYITRITFDLMNVIVPGVFQKNFSTTWTDIDKQLTENEHFGKQLRISNLMKNELAAALKDNMSSQDKVVVILDLVKEKIQWNDDDALYIDNVRKAVREGKGSSAEMNAALICLLRDAGFDAYPVVMSLRSRGRIFPPSPTLKSLNYFLTGVNIDGNPAYMDASDKYGTVNVIPSDCMVQDARSIFKDKPAIWVDLHELGKNGSITTIKAEFNDDGRLSGTVQKTMSGVPCISYSRKVDKQKSLEDTQAEMETELNIRISNLDQGKPKNVSVTENFSFESNDIASGDDYIYLNTLIFPPITDNPFKAETRKLPVEFPYPSDQLISVTIAIPDGYDLDEAPASESITLLDNRQMSYSYRIQKIERNIMISQRITVRQTLYPATEYEHVRDFWAHIASKNNAQLVLKRVSKQ